MKTILLLIIVSLVTIFASSADLDKTAYRAYKKGQYKKAFELYKKSSSTKAVYNLAQFYEQGIGTQKNRQKAKELYKNVAYKIDLHSYKTCESEMLPYYRITLKKLKKFTRLRKLKKLCKRDKNPFLQECPEAKTIPMRYRTGVENFNCFYYKKFSNSMKRLLKIHSKIISYDSEFWEDLVKKHKQEIIHSIQPIIRYHTRKGSKCINRAVYKRDIKNCFGKYKAFLYEAFISGELSVGIPEESKKIYEANVAKEEAKLNAKATQIDKEKALQELKNLHNHIKSYHF